MNPCPGYSNDEAIDLRDVNLLEVCGGEETSIHVCLTLHTSVVARRPWIAAGRGNSKGGGSSVALWHLGAWRLLRSTGTVGSTVKRMVDVSRHGHIGSRVGCVEMRVSH
jgi:hypothetical protein